MASRKSSILKPRKIREPLQDLNQLIPNNEEEETTTTIEIQKRRVSFASTNKVKEFEVSAECMTLLYTPAYDERFSVSSDSYQSSICDQSSHNKSVFQTSTANAGGGSGGGRKSICPPSFLDETEKAPLNLSSRSTDMDLTEVGHYVEEKEEVCVLNLSKKRNPATETPHAGKSGSNSSRDLDDSSNMEMTDVLPCPVTEEALLYAQSQQRSQINEAEPLMHETDASDIEEEESFVLYNSELIDNRRFSRKSEIFPALGATKKRLSSEMIDAEDGTKTSVKRRSLENDSNTKGATVYEEGSVTETQCMDQSRHHHHHQKNTSTTFEKSITETECVRLAVTHASKLILEVDEIAEFSMKDTTTHEMSMTFTQPHQGAEIEVNSQKNVTTYEKSVTETQCVPISNLILEEENENPFAGYAPIGGGGKGGRKSMAAVREISVIDDESQSADQTSGSLNVSRRSTNVHERSSTAQVESKNVCLQRANKSISSSSRQSVTAQEKSMLDASSRKSVATHEAAGKVETPNRSSVGRVNRSGRESVPPQGATSIVETSVHDASSFPQADRSRRSVTAHEKKCNADEVFNESAPPAGNVSARKSVTSEEKVAAAAETLNESSSSSAAAAHPIGGSARRRSITTSLEKSREGMLNESSAPKINTSIRKSVSLEEASIVETSIHDTSLRRADQSRKSEESNAEDAPHESAHPINESVAKSVPPRAETSIVEASSIHETSLRRADRSRDSVTSHAKSNVAEVLNEPAHPINRSSGARKSVSLPETSILREADQNTSTVQVVTKSGSRKSIAFPDKSSAPASNESSSIHPINGSVRESVTARETNNAEEAASARVDKSVSSSRRTSLTDDVPLRPNESAHSVNKSLSEASSSSSAAANSLVLQANSLVLQANSLVAELNEEPSAFEDVVVVDNLKSPRKSRFFDDADQSPQMRREKSFAKTPEKSKPPVEGEETQMQEKSFANLSMVANIGNSFCNRLMESFASPAIDISRAVDKEASEKASITERDISMESESKLIAAEEEEKEERIHQRGGGDGDETETNETLKIVTEDLKEVVEVVVAVAAAAAAVAMDPQNENVSSAQLSKAAESESGVAVTDSGIADALTPTEEKRLTYGMEADLNECSPPPPNSCVTNDLLQQELEKRWSKNANENPDEHDVYGKPKETDSNISVELCAPVAQITVEAVIEHFNDSDVSSSKASECYTPRSGKTVTSAKVPERCGILPQSCISTVARDCDEDSKKVDTVLVEEIIIEHVKETSGNVRAEPESVAEEAPPSERVLPQAEVSSVHEGDSENTKAHPNKSSEPCDAVVEAVTELNTSSKYTECVPNKDGTLSEVAECVAPENTSLTTGDEVTEDVPNTAAEEEEEAAAAYHVEPQNMSMSEVEEEYAAENAQPAEITVAKVEDQIMETEEFSDTHFITPSKPRRTYAIPETKDKKSEIFENIREDIISETWRKRKWHVKSESPTEWVFHCLWENLELVVTFADVLEDACSCDLRFTPHADDPQVHREVAKIAVSSLMRKFRPKLRMLCSSGKDVPHVLKLLLPSIVYAENLIKNLVYTVGREDVEVENGIAKFWLSSYKMHLLGRIYVNMSRIEKISLSDIRVKGYIGRIDIAMVHETFSESGCDYDFFQKFVRSLWKKVNP